MLLAKQGRCITSRSQHGAHLLPPPVPARRTRRRAALLGAGVPPPSTRAGVESIALQTIPIGRAIHGGDNAPQRTYSPSLVWQGVWVGRLSRCFCLLGACGFNTQSHAEPLTKDASIKRPGGEGSFLRCTQGSVSNSTPRPPS